MSRIHGRLQRLERELAGSDVCPACRGSPAPGMMVVHKDEAGNVVSQEGSAQCPACGRIGPATWLIIERDPN